MKASILGIIVTITFTFYTSALSMEGNDVFGSMAKLQSRMMQELPRFSLLPSGPQGTLERLCCSSVAELPSYIDNAFVSTLILQGAYTNRQNESLYTPLHFAAINGNSTMVKALLRFCADPKAVNVR